MSCPCLSYQTVKAQIQQEIKGGKSVFPYDELSDASLPIFGYGWLFK